MLNKENEWFKKDKELTDRMMRLSEAIGYLKAIIDIENRSLDTMNKRLDNMLKDKEV